MGRPISNLALVPPKVVDDERLPKLTGNSIGHAGAGILGLRVEMKDVLLAEWALLLERNKARFNPADLDEISPQIRAALLEFGIVPAGQRSRDAGGGTVIRIARETAKQ
jgi:hypothetical protein